MLDKVLYLNIKESILNKQKQTLQGTTIIRWYGPTALLIHYAELPWSVPTAANSALQTIVDGLMEDVVVGKFS